MLSLYRRKTQELAKQIGEVRLILIRGEKNLQKKNGTDPWGETLLGERTPLKRKQDLWFRVQKDTKTPHPIEGGSFDTANLNRTGLKSCQLGGRTWLLSYKQEKGKERHQTAWKKGAGAVTGPRIVS